MQAQDKADILRMYWDKARYFTDGELNTLAWKVPYTGCDNESSYVSRLEDIWQELKECGWTEEECAILILGGYKADSLLKQSGTTAQDRADFLRVCWDKAQYFTDGGLNTLGWQYPFLGLTPMDYAMQLEKEWRSWKDRGWTEEECVILILGGKKAEELLKQER